MATLNVFELTQAELSKSLKESKTTGKKTRKRGIKESARIGRKYRTAKKISANKLKVEGLQFVREAEENDEVVDYTPEEDVVLVIDPDMDETPETEEAAEDAAEELVGDYVCKCSICGANYVIDAEDFVEDTTESECPVCGETGEQILVGEITPSEDEIVSDEEDEIVVDDEFEGEDEIVDDDESEDDDEIVVDDEFEDEDSYEESIARAKRRTALRRESNTRRPGMRKSRVECRTRTPKRSNNYNLDEVVLNRMLTKFAKENYDNVRFVKITKGSCKRGRLTLEGTIITTKGSQRSTKFVCENFKPSTNIHANFVEIGAFTENAISRGPAFTIDFKTRNNVITPVSLRYSYKVKEGRNKYAVTGKVMNESLRKRSK